MKTITVQIGNSDDKLTQQEWSEFVHITHDVIFAMSRQIHFYACSDSASKWQNAAWVFEIDNDPINEMSLQATLVDVRGKYKQDALAWTEGATLFI